MPDQNAGGLPMTFTEALFNKLSSLTIGVAIFVLAYLVFHFFRRWWRGQALWHAQDLKVLATWIAQIACLTFLISAPGDIARSMGWSDGQLLILFGLVFTVVMLLLWARGELNTPAQTKKHDQPKD